MNNRKDKILRKIITTLVLSVVVALVVIFNEFFIYILSQTALFAAKTYLPSEGITLPAFIGTTAEEVTETTTAEATTEKEVAENTSLQVSFTDTPDDIKQVIVQREKTASKDKKDGATVPCPVPADAEGRRQRCGHRSRWCAVRLVHCS